MKNGVMRKLKIISLFFLFLIGWFAYSYFCTSRHKPSERFINEVCQKISSRYRIHDGYVIIVDYSRASCSNRLHIYDRDKGKIVFSGKVLHGKGGGSTASKPVFSNKVGSNCSSLGLFRVKNFDNLNNYPIVPCFRLDGLDSSCSNAMARGILIHPSIMASMFPFESDRINFPLSISCLGCFTTSFCGFLKVCQLKKTGKPMFIYSYNVS